MLMSKTFNFTVNSFYDGDRCRDQDDYQDHTITVHDEFTIDIKLDTTTNDVPEGVWTTIDNKLTTSTTTEAKEVQDWNIESYTTCTLCATIYGTTITMGTMGTTMISNTVIEFHTIEEEAVRTTKKGQSCITTIVLSTIQHVLPVPIEVLLNKKFDQIPCTT